MTSSSQCSVTSVPPLWQRCFCCFMECSPKDFQDWGFLYPPSFWLQWLCIWNIFVGAKNAPIITWHYPNHFLHNLWPDGWAVFNVDISECALISDSPVTSLTLSGLLVAVCLVPGVTWMYKPYDTIQELISVCCGYASVSPPGAKVVFCLPFFRCPCMLPPLVALAAPVGHDIQLGPCFYRENNWWQLTNVASRFQPLLEGQSLHIARAIYFYVLSSTELRKAVNILYKKYISWVAK